MWILEMKEKNLKIVSQESKKTMQNETIQQKSYQGDKILGQTLYKILGTILETDEGRTSINGPEKKKSNDNA